MLFFVSFIASLSLFASSASAWVKPGIDNVEMLPLLYGKRLGLITNPSGVNYNLEGTVDRMFFHMPQIKLVALFAPEHGLRGDKQAGEPFDDYVDPITGLTVYSLYSKNRTYAPTKEQIEKNKIEMFVMDLQDVGCRCYTYVTTMARCLNATALYGIPFVILDRVNPVGAREKDIQGPILDMKFKTFIGPWNIPVQHAMTIGELGQMFNVEMSINHPSLTVIKLVYSDGAAPRAPEVYNNARWLLPSPNLPTLLSGFLYPGSVMAEAFLKVSLGRGTTIPFSVLGAPFFENLPIIAAIHEKVKADPPIAKYFANVTIIPIYFAPTMDPYLNTLCPAIQIVPLFPDEYQSTQSLPILLTVLSTLVDRYGANALGLRWQELAIRIGNNQTFTDLVSGTPVSRMMATWAGGLAEFRQRRRKYLLYSDPSQQRDERSEDEIALIGDVL